MTQTKRIFHLALIGLLVLSASALAKSKKTRCENVPLVWSPTDELGDLAPVSLTGLTDISIEVAPFTDARSEPPEKIGENVEDVEDYGLKLATTQDDVPTFVRQHFVGLLGDFGFRTTDSGGDVRLEVELRKFFVREGDTYEGEVRLLVKMKDGGKTTYEALVGGSATRWGRSYKAENYFETLSDSLIDAVHNMVTSNDFRTALRAAK